MLDPTCGSGAFLFAALNILEPLYEACLDRMEAFVDDLDRVRREAHAREVRGLPQGPGAASARTPTAATSSSSRIILNNLFGVDIMEEAVEICKLRLFLKLVAQVEPDATKTTSASSRCRTSTSTSAPATRWSATRPTTRSRSAVDQQARFRQRDGEDRRQGRGSSADVRRIPPAPDRRRRLRARRTTSWNSRSGSRRWKTNSTATSPANTA